jgi:transcriptional regulator with XRE-family HTH domain
MSPGVLVHSVRKRHRLTQAQLAVRAGTSQNAISRIERDELSPSVDTLCRLLAVMGERLELAAQPLAGNFDPDHLADSLAQSMDERLARSLAWNRLGGQLAGAALRAEP